MASTAWAKFIVDGDLSYQIDARKFRMAGLRVTSPWDVRALIKGLLNHSIPMVFNRFTKPMRA